MPKCEYCGKEVLLPFECLYCGKTFCTEHRLPENHQCTNLPEKPFWYQKQKATEKEAKKKRLKEEGELHFTKEASTSREELKREAPKQKIHGANKKLILAFCTSLIITSVIVAYTSYNLGYSVRHDVAYDMGYNLGHSEGYNEGYFDGNESGYQVGYGLGCSSGNSSGYEIGYNKGYHLGNQTGYNSGYFLGFYDGNETGFGDGYNQGVEDGAGRGYTIRDPTYEEVTQFITSDQTDKNEYNKENYTCANFAADIKNNAFTIGYRCGYVGIEFPDSAHAIVCFDTIDHGLIFIEPQDDEIVTLEIGQPYWDRTKYPEPTYDDTIIRFLIVW